MRDRHHRSADHPRRDHQAQRTPLRGRAVVVEMRVLSHNSLMATILLSSGGFVALTWKGQDEPSEGFYSGGKAKQLVHEADFACRFRLCQTAMAAADHSHHLKAFDGGAAVFILWKPRVGRITRLSAPWSASMMLFKYFDVRCSTFFDSRPSFCRRWIALGYDASLSVVMMMAESRSLSSGLCAGSDRRPWYCAGPTA